MSFRGTRGITCIAGVLACSLGATLPTLKGALADDFYKGKQIICYSSGSGTYAAYARYVGKYMTKYIPGNPTWVVKEMRGASGLKLANYMYKKAKKDGTEIAAIHGHILTTPLFESRGVEYKTDEFNWIGSATKEVYTSIVMNKNTTVRSIADLKTTPTKFGGQAVGSFSVDMAILVKKFMGLDKLQILTGYQGSSENRLAMERGEIDGVMGTSYTAVTLAKPDWIPNKVVTVIGNMASSPDPRMPSVPIWSNLIKDKDQRDAYNLYAARQETGKPYFTAPGVPKERVEMLRAAFDKAIKDPAYIAEVEKANLEIMDPMSGPEIDAFLKKIGTTAKPSTVKLLNEAWASFADQKM